MISTYVSEFNQYSLYQNLDEAIQYLIELKERLSQDGWKQLSLYNEGYESGTLVLHGYRPETDEERENRVQREEETRHSQLKRDRKEFERLKKKLGEK